MARTISQITAAFIGLALLSACAAPAMAPIGERPGKWEITSRFVITADGLPLPLRSWIPERAPKAIVLGLHGFNDYSGAFRDVGPKLAAGGITLYAYDQRGFGQAPHAGRWAGGARMRQDAIAIARALNAGAPDIPLYLLGLSMGGAVAMTALADAPDAATGAILVGPAVWGRDHMPGIMSATLDAFAHLTPGYTLTGEGVRITPTDNIAELRRMARDPSVRKSTRIDMVYGLMNLMDEAQASAALQQTPLLLLYGLKDDLVPKVPTLRALKALPQLKGRTPHRIAVYDNGRHMLLRDKAGVHVIADIAAWITNPDAQLPSGQDQNALKRLQEAADE
jgi:alpha-beta hydrolase superfamily lysophospholipase